MVWQSTDAQTQAALASHGSTIATEVLATSWTEGSVSGANVVDEELGFRAKLTKN